MKSTLIDWCGITLDVNYDIWPADYGFPLTIEIDNVNVGDSWFETDDIEYRGIPLIEWIQNKIASGDY
jgi:hypothetical protein